ncbi:hypothetical protein CR513_42573, partial [Mucuna pruriens]
MVNPNQNDWSRFLEDALLAHRTAYWTPLEMSPYQIVFSKACHRPVEIEHQAYWAIKKCNTAYGQERKLILRKEFRVFQKVLLFNSRLKLIVGKLHSRWDDPFVITNVFPYGAEELREEANNKNFKVNGHQIKPYYEGPSLIVREVERISLVAHYKPNSQKTMIHLNLEGSKELWNCFGSRFHDKCSDDTLRNYKSNWHLNKVNLVDKVVLARRILSRPTPSRPDEANFVSRSQSPRRVSTPTPIADFVSNSRIQSMC